MLQIKNHVNFIIINKRPSPLDLDDKEKKKKELRPSFIITIN